MQRIVSRKDDLASKSEPRDLHLAWRSARQAAPWLLGLVSACALMACGGADAPPGATLAAGQSPISSSAVATSGSAVAVEPAANAAGYNAVLGVDSQGFTTSGSFAKLSVRQGPEALRGEVGASATVSKILPSDGLYEVFVRWPSAGAGAGVAKVLIDSKEGQHQVEVDQAARAGVWFSVGAYPFEAARAAQVKITGSSGGGFVIDGVRLMLRDSSFIKPSLAQVGLAVGVVGDALISPVDVAGGKPPFNTSVVAGELPVGLRLDAKTGFVIGTPGRSGAYKFSLEVVDARGQKVVREFRMAVVEKEGGASEPAAERAAAAVDKAMGRRLQAYSGAAPNLAGLNAIVASMAPGEWRAVSLNRFDSAWPPLDLREITSWGSASTQQIIAAWSSFAWDSGRANLMLWGGGHGNYAGNEVYQWRGSNQLWERASLPSALVTTPLGYYTPIDGAANAPVASHTYETLVYLPVVDRMLVLGGAAYNHGGQFMTDGPGVPSRMTGPYLWDPAKADGDKVGGSTGSHVQRAGPFPSIVGGNMWQNRESWANASATSSPPLEGFGNACTGYNTEGGKDVVYVRTQRRLYRYVINDLNDPASDQWTKVGTWWYGYGVESACAFDPGRNIFVTTNDSLTHPFVFWNLATASPDNRDVAVAPTDPSGEFAGLVSSGALDMRTCGLDRDPVRNNFKLWCGDGRVWELNPPASASALGWTIVKASVPPAGSVVPTLPVVNGILGKWKYIPNLDVFMGLVGVDTGTVWIYKPAGWVNQLVLANLPPTVSITGPSSGSTFHTTAAVPLAVNASDSDGSIAKVEYFANGVKVGESTSAPFNFSWSGAALGTYSVSAIATDNLGSTGTSGVVSVTITTPPPTNLPPNNLVWVTPAVGSSYVAGTPITLAATASDPDGSIARIDFLDGSTLIGSATSAPFTFVWNGASVGSHTLFFVAVDNQGAGTASVSRSVLVTSAPAVTSTLQRGTSSSVVVDATPFVSDPAGTTGAANTLIELSGNYSPMLRFAIFQSEGGPVPNGATIDAATLSLYKTTKGALNFSLHRVLQNWDEATVTWQKRTAASNWAVAGANGVGTDVAATAAASVSGTTAAGWLSFDLTSSVQAMSTGGGNFGWKLKRSGQDTVTQHRFYSSEVSTTSLRPKLVVTYR